MIKNKALGLISNWPIDEMIVAFDCQEPNTLWEFYNSPSNTKKAGSINAIAKKIVEFERNGWISSLKYCFNNNPPKSLICLLWASLDMHADTIADNKNLTTKTTKKERRMLKQLYKSLIESALPAMIANNHPQETMTLMKPC